jgi:hypothetical protein
MMEDHPAWPTILESLLMARRHAIQKDVNADAEYLLKTAAEVAPYLMSEDNDDDE